MTKNKTVRYSSDWQKIANNKHDIRNKIENYKKAYELINMDHTFGSLIRYKEYNKNLYKLWEFLCKDENKHITKTLSLQDKDFYFDDLINVHIMLDQLVEVGLQDEKDVDDWTVFSGGHIGRKSLENNEKGVN